MEPEMLMAYADGELDPIEAKRVERAIAADPSLAARVEQHRAVRARLGAHFAPVAEEPVPDRLAAILQSNVVGLPGRQPRRILPAWSRWGGALAASLVLGLAIGHGWQDSGIVRSQGGQIYADGTLAKALDRQVAVAQGAVQVPISFRSNAGQYCRVFTSPATDGIACRDAEGWLLHQTRAGAAGAKTDYMQAGSTDPALMAAAQQMMAGDPLDAAAEMNARAAGWR
ncbi:anti-sigma factor [Sphingomonas sp. JC676]|nr:anti-sigma factor [Sphingomonas sp. JC676]